MILLIFYAAKVKVIVGSNSNNLNIFAECGKGSRITPTMIGGETFERGTYPWLVALIYTGNNMSNFFCGGVLVNETTVLTGKILLQIHYQMVEIISYLLSLAAHCLQGKTHMQILNKRDLTIAFGVHDLSNQKLNGITFGAAKEIILHPDWQISTADYDADLAAIILDIPVVFTQFVRPICIWDQIHELRKESGVVAGWGKSENNPYENIPKQLVTSIWDNEHCLTKNPEMARASSKRTLCGGDQNGKAPCLGDR